MSPHSTPSQSAQARGILAPDRVVTWPHPSVSVMEIGGGRITYAIQGSERGPLILYFHGWGDDFRTVLALEHPLIDAGYRLLVVHRPGYAGTTLGGKIDGKAVDWRTPAGFAKITAELLDRLHDASNWEIAVIGTSGGAPTALAFAALCRQQTKTLVIQAGVSQPWSEAELVPALFRRSYLTAFQHFGWAGDRFSKLIFGLLVKVRESRLSDEDKVRALTGSRLEDAKRDPAFDAVVATILREDPANKLGEFNDVFKIFFSKSAYCRWESIQARTLILHDPEDQFVPYVHAERAAQRVSNARLCTYRLAGHVLWLGADATAMHKTRLDFLKGSGRVHA